MARSALIAVFFASIWGTQALACTDLSGNYVGPGGTGVLTFEQQGCEQLTVTMVVNGHTTSHEVHRMDVAETSQGNGYTGTDLWHWVNDTQLVHDGKFSRISGGDDQEMVTLIQLDAKGNLFNHSDTYENGATTDSYDFTLPRITHRRHHD